MKIRAFMFLCFCVFVFSCGGEEPDAPIGKPEPVCYKQRIVLPSPINIKIWFDPEKWLPEDFVLNSLNAYWSELGVKVEKAVSPEEAHYGLVYACGACSKPIFAGSLQGAEIWGDLKSIIVDYTCFDEIPGYKQKFPAAVSHALLNLLGVEGYPAYCSNGIMANPVVMFAEENPPQKISEGDKKSYAQRTSFTNDVVWRTICEEPKEWETGKYSAPNEEVYSFSLSAELVDQPVEEQLNSYFKLFGRQFEEKPEAHADFSFKLWNLDDNLDFCSPTAMAIPDERVIYLKPACLKPEIPYRSETIFAHEVAHLFGMNHIPHWCGNAIMQPYINPGPSFTPTDVKEWQSRDFGLACLY